MRRILMVLAVMATGLAGMAQSARADLNVALTVAERHSEARSNEPVTAGVPLPEGQFKDVSKLRLVDDDGNEVPCQFTPTVKWFRDGSIRWVLLDFPASVPAFATRTYYLRDDGPAKAVESPVTVEQDEERIVVNTGVLKFAVRKKGFNLIDEAWVDESGQGQFDEAHQVIKPKPFSGPVLWSNAPNLPVFRTYKGSNDAACEVAVEEAGPMRVVIKATGRHLADDAKGDADKLLDFNIRIYAYRGQSALRVVYSAECRQGEQIHNFFPVDRWHLVVPGSLGKPDELTYRFGTPGADIAGTFGRQDRAWLVCEDADSYEAGGAAYHHSTSGVLKGPAMSIRPPGLGWVDLSGPSGGITVAVRWFWQNNPKGLFVQRDGSVHAALWPSFVRKTAITSDNRRANFFPGMSKTHEIMVYLHGAKPGRAGSQVNAMLQQPLFAAADPSWYCQETQAFGRLASSDASLFDDKTARMVANYDFFFEQNRREMQRYREFNRGLNAYGMFNFGDHINHVTDARRDKNGERPDPTDVHWGNNYYGFPHAMLIQFLRTGNRDMLDYAETCSVHLQDVDIHCWHPNERFIGAPQYSAGLDHIRIYGNGDPVYTSNTYNHYKNQSLFERFWLKGDRLALERGLLSAGFARTHTTNALSQGRSVGHGIIMLLCAYETTGDTSYLEAAEKIVDKTRGFTRTRSGAWQDGIALEGHRYWYEVTGDKRAIDTVKAGVDAAEQKRDRAGSILQAYAFIYGQTGEQKYRDAAVSAMDRTARGKKESMIGFGNSFRNTAYVWWYLSKDLPKKEEVPVLKWKE